MSDNQDQETDELDNNQSPELTPGKLRIHSEEKSVVNDSQPEINNEPPKTDADIDSKLESEPETVTEIHNGEVVDEVDRGSNSPESDSVFESSQRSSLPSLSGILSSFSGRGDFWSTSSQSPTSEPVQAQPLKDSGPDYAAQRKNLALVAKIATRALIDPCLEKSIVLEETYPPLVQFLFVLEYVLLHGLKSKVSMFNKNKSFWAGFHSKYMESLDKSLKDTNRTVQDMPGIKTGIGRARAFIRLALMAKKLPDYLDALQSSDQQFRAEYWEDWSLIRNDEAPEIFGHMQGLSIVDANLSIKGANLDGQIGFIDFSLINAVTESHSNDNHLIKENKRLLDQKSFLEERNRQLEDRLKLRSDKLDVTDETKNQIEAELRASQITIKELQTELDATKSASSSDMSALKESFEHQKSQFATSLSESENKIQQLEKQYGVLEKQMKTETKDRIELEKLLEEEIKQKQQLELGIRLLEQDSYEKVDTLEQLQKQLEDTRSINLRLFEEIREKNEKEKMRIKKLEESHNALSTLRDESEAIQTEHERLKLQEIEFSDQRLRYESEIDVLKVQLLKFESDLNQETEHRRIAENEAQAAKSVAQNLRTELSGSQKLAVTLADDNEKLKETAEQLESALAEMAAQLENAKIDHDDMKDLHDSLTGHKWIDEKSVKTCYKCQRDFTLKRRKHHCRNCGNVFCGACSGNTMVLASNPKPVRVCDTCHTLLLARVTS